MENEVECFSTPFIDEDSNFNEVALDNFIKKSKLEECGLSYAVVAIMGAQSSGKSTLLNYLFHTNFKEMDADDGICKTTQGIWIARCVGIEPCTIVMDLEGTDGKERGENTTFEKRSALFALAVSDIVLFNLWCKDIGLQHAASRPLLKTIFAVMLKLSITPRKTTFMIVIRDKTRTPLIKLEQGLREDIQKIWDSIPKPEAHKNTLLSDYLNVQVVALCSYVDKEEQFKEEVANLRQRFFRSIAPGGLAGDRQRLVPASGFSCSAQQIWEVIKVNKDLDLPSLAVLVATIRCEQIANEKYSSFLANEDWLELEEAVQSQLVSRFGQILSSLIHNCLSSYDKEATDYEESVGHVKRKGLETKLMELVQPSYDLMLEHIQSGTLEDFKQALNITLNEGQAGFAIVARDCKRKFTILFDEKCQDTVIEQANWDSAKIRRNFLLDLDSHLTQVKTAKLSALATLYETRLKEKLCDPVRALLKVGSDDTWPRITNLVSSETRNIVSDFKNSGFEMDEQSRDMISKLTNYPREIVERMAREEVGIVMYRMKDRFISLFCYDKDSMPRVWTKKEDILAITKTARSSSLKLLSVLAAIRLDKYNDTIEDTLFSALLDPKKKENLLASHTWEKVPVNKTLITPIECKSLWDRFLDETNYDIIRANASRKANKEETNMEFAKGFVAGVSGAAGVVGVVCAIVL